MKKLILILAVFFGNLQSRADVYLIKGMQIDTIKLNKQIKKLDLKLAGLNSQLIEIRTRIPVDSVNVENTLNRSHEAQVKSKKRSEQAIGGDVDDMKLAEKQAKKASKETKAAEDATKQLEDDRKELKKVQKQLIKTQKELETIRQVPV